MPDTFSTAVHSSRDAWIKHRQALEQLKQSAEQKPASAALVFEEVAEKLRQKAIADLWYFTVASPQARLQMHEPAEVDDAYSFDSTEERPTDHEVFELLQEKEASKTPEKALTLDFEEEFGAVLAHGEYARYTTARILMEEAGERSRAAGEGYFGPAVCTAFLECLDQAPAVHAGEIQRKYGGDQRVRNRALASLAGWVGARIRLESTWRHTRALAEDGKEPLEELLRMLPAAVAIGWKELERSESPESLVRRVERQAEGLGRETSRLERSGKLSDIALPDIGEREDEIEEFIQRETLQQERTQLEQWTEQAQFKGLMRQVYDLDMKTDHNTSYIASELSIEEANVRKVRERYRAKLRKAAGL